MVDEAQVSLEEGEAVAAADGIVPIEEMRVQAEEVRVQEGVPDQVQQEVQAVRDPQVQREEILQVLLQVLREDQEGEEVRVLQAPAVQDVYDLPVPSGVQEDVQEGAAVLLLPEEEGVEEVLQPVQEVHVPVQVQEVPVPADEVRPTVQVFMHAQVLGSEWVWFFFLSSLELINRNI